MTSATEACRWHLSPRHPLHTYLKAVALPEAGIEVREPYFEIASLGGKRGMYLYRERKSGALLVCKFFGGRFHLSQATRDSLLNREFSYLRMTRSMGFNGPPHIVVRPLGMSQELNSVLVEDFVRGHDLDYYIAKAAYEGQHDRLFDKLSKMAHFLAELHNRTASLEKVDLSAVSRKFRKILKVLVRRHVADDWTANHLRQLCHTWEQASEVGADNEVIVHGDVTPTNFIFDHERGVTAIDLERMHEGDRMYDVGMLTGELKHHFAWRIGRPDAAEPFIGHFLWAYCEQFPDRDAYFRAVAHRNRFYMALCELRIARNDWIPLEHRKWLVREASKCLE